MSEMLSAHAQRVIVAIDEGRRFRRSGEGWAAGPLRVPSSLIKELERRDMIRVAGEGLALADGGRGWIARRSPGPRLLAERPLPQDGTNHRRAGRPAARSVTVNLAESPLGWLKARGLIDERQFEAGERLRGDWTVAGLGPRVTMRWDAAGSSGSTRGAPDILDPTLARIAAKRRMEAALDAAGAGLKDMLWRIVCAGEGMESAERAMGWPVRAGRVVLTLALDRLADFYGLP